MKPATPVTVEQLLADSPDDTSRARMRLTHLRRIFAARPEITSAGQLEEFVGFFEKTRFNVCKAADSQSRINGLGTFLLVPLNKRLERFGFKPIPTMNGRAKRPRRKPAR